MVKILNNSIELKTNEALQKIRKKKLKAARKTSDSLAMSTESLLAIVFIPAAIVAYFSPKIGFEEVGVIGFLLGYVFLLGIALLVLKTIKKVRAVEQIERETAEIEKQHSLPDLAEKRRFVELTMTAEAMDAHYAMTVIDSLRTELDRTNRNSLIQAELVAINNYLAALVRDTGYEKRAEGERLEDLYSNALKGRVNHDDS